MHINADQYMEAARQRGETARRLHDDDRFSAAVYMAGVSVECLLRAFIVSKDPQFDSRHDLNELFRDACIEEMVPKQERRQIGAWLGEVWSRWKNDYRYASDDCLRSKFNDLSLYRIRGAQTMKGCVLKENSRIAINAALELKTKGELAWRRAKKSSVV